jgi:murein DD-endopeptidase MepM/ murein hydrolase activator NlpD
VIYVRTQRVGMHGMWSVNRMTNATSAPLGFVRDREFFVHDGTRLRRFRVSAAVQAAILFALVSLVAWSGYAAARLTAPAEVQLSSAAVSERQLSALASAAEARARHIEQRQELLIALLAGEHVDHRQVAAAAQSNELPGSLDAPFERVEQVQSAQAAAAARALDARYRLAAAELRKLGINPARLAGGMGGPLEPAGKGDPTFKQLFMSWKKLDNLHDNAIAVPAEKPVKQADFTSGFGVRSDPFRGSAAMHAGIDLAGPIGTPIYATADGIITEAGWNNGGYGNLIKISHGRGIETRYGHLASIDVRPGQAVKRGQVIARMGSTGRSTGSHLHYEVRIDGRAVNPIPFMKSTDYLLAMQRAGSNRPMDVHVAQGGPTKGVAPK